MKVTRNTPDQLIIADTPWLIAIMLLVFILCFVGAGLMIMAETPLAGLFFSIFGGGMGLLGLAVFVKRVQVILDRPGGTVTIRKRSVFGYAEVQHALEHLSHAQLEEMRSKQNRILARPVLVLKDGMSAGLHPVIESYTNGNGPKRLVDAVNSWLKTPPAE